MKHTLLLFFACFGLAFPLSAQYGLLGGADGFVNNGYDQNNPFILGFGAGGSRIFTGSPLQGGNTFFRLVTNNNSGNRDQVGPNNCPGTDDDVTGRMAQNIQGSSCASGAFRIANTNTAWTYVIKTPTADNGSYRFLFFEIQGTPVTVDAVTQFPASDGNGEVPANQNVTLTATLSNGSIPPTGQAIYLRYSTDNFATSTVVPFFSGVDVTGNATNQASIPGQEDETDLQYYVFTSGSAVAPAADGSDADYRTINLNNNGNANYAISFERALPVTLSDWHGKRDKQNAVLEWSTATEDNASHFTVECSADNGGSWMERGTVRATNISGSDYRFLDSNVPTAELSYRLRQVDLDGSEELSAIVRLPGNEEALRLWPQPAAAGQAVLDVSLDFLGADAQLIDADGRLRSSFVVDGPRYRLPTDSLEPGVYFLVIRGEQLETRRVVIGQ